MNVNEQMAMICPKCFSDTGEYNKLKQDLISQNKIILEISEEQAAANATDYIVVNANNLRYILMNKSSFEILSHDQTKALLAYGNLVLVDLSSFYEYNRTRLVDMLTLIN